MFLKNLLLFFKIKNNVLWIKSYFNNEIVSRLTNLYGRFKIEPIIIENNRDLETKRIKHDNILNLIIINGNIISDATVESIIKKEPRSYIIVIKKDDFDTLNFPQVSRISEKQIQQIERDSMNLLLKKLIELRVSLTKLAREIQSDIKITLSYKKKLRQPKKAYLKEQTKPKHLYLFSFLLIVEIIVASSFAFKNDKYSQVFSLLNAANNIQRKKRDPYVSAEVKGLELDYLNLLHKINDDSKFHNSISPYVKLQETIFSLNSIDFPVTTLAIKDYTSNNEVLKKIPLSLYKKDHDESLKKLSGLGILITSSYADYLIKNHWEFKTYSDIIGHKTVNPYGVEFEILNIIFTTDTNANTDISPDFFRYHEHNIGIGKHLLNLFGDYAFVIGDGDFVQSEPKYYFSYYPKSKKIVNFIENKFTLGANDIIFKTIGPKDGFVQNDLYGKMFNYLQQDNDDYLNNDKIALLIVASLLFILLIRILTDLLTGNITYINIVAMFSAQLMYLLFSLFFNIFVTNPAFLSFFSIYSTLPIFVIIVAIILLITIKLIKKEVRILPSKIKTNIDV